MSNQSQRSKSKPGVKLCNGSRTQTHAENPIRKRTSTVLSLATDLRSGVFFIPSGAYYHNENGVVIALHQGCSFRTWMSHICGAYHACMLFTRSAEFASNIMHEKAVGMGGARPHKMSRCDT